MGEIQDGSAVFTVRDKRAQAFVDLVYPVGIVVALANDKKPAFMNYGKWEKVAEDRVLQGASDSNAPGKKIEPGLPNITGHSEAHYAGDINFLAGAFYRVDNSKEKLLGGAYGGAQSSYGRNYTGFDASRSNSIYGKSTTVQPPAYVVAYWQRTE